MRTTTDGRPAGSRCACWRPGCCSAARRSPSGVRRAQRRAVAASSRSATTFTSGINPIEFDPAQFNSSACCFDYDWPIYAGLLRETTSGAYVPDLASSVTIPNSTTIDVQMRPGLVYSNGTPLNAAAVKAGYERNLANPHTGAGTPPFTTSRPSTSPGPTRWSCTSPRPWPAPSIRSWPTRSRSWRSRPGRARASRTPTWSGPGPSC